MDNRTATFMRLHMRPRTVEETIAGIDAVYDKIRLYEAMPLTDGIIERIFSEIDKEFYNDTFVKFIAESVPDKPAILFKDNKGDCDDVSAILEATIYEETDPEFASYLYAFVTATSCLNSIAEGSVYYSGGYVTTNKLKFIVLMLLHESIHILEYNDPILTIPRLGVEHNAFFYKTAYIYFKFISRLSQYFTPAEARRQIKYNSQQRITDIDRLIISVDDNKLSLTEDGTDIINNHSHYRRRGKNTLLGYIAYERFRGRLLGGARTRRQHARKYMARRISYRVKGRIKPPKYLCDK